MSSNKPEIFVIGDINIDLSLKGIGREFCFSENLGREINLDDVSLEVGGSGFNFVKIGNSMGLDINFTGKIGDDFFGDYINGYLKRRKIKNRLIKSNKVKTGITVLFPVDKDRIYLTYNSGSKNLDIKEVPVEDIKNYNHLHYSSYYLLEKLQEHTIEIFKYLKNKTTISFDTGIDPKNEWQKDNILSILEYTDVFLPNRAEALNITKSNNIEDALDVLSDYCDLVVLKLGSEGSVAVQKNNKKKKKIFMPPFEIEFRDNSCCGDSFNAGFVYSYLRGETLEESLKFASACGALQATKLGNYNFKGKKDIYNFIERRN
ncbi:MAG: carbohydrate kinase family protein [Actinobacteria bacterium]|nr:carbohydrate kinase family protein [Actinomycetota bacterium]